jgi:hypothetical protein
MDSTEPAPGRRLHERNFPSAVEEAAAVGHAACYEGPQSSYRLAFTDTDFLLRDELRPVRMQLELLEPELIQQEQGIESMIMLLGSAGIVPPEDAAAALEKARTAGKPAAIRRAEVALEMSGYYDEARRFAGIVTLRSREHATPIYVVTGGGPGIMEAGNRGAHDVGSKSIGPNMVLPREQAPNPYITPELCFRFHCFALRKMHVVMRSIALLCFPGGFGTLDELFETLTLAQTGKSRARPMLRFGRRFWKRLIDLQHLVDTGMIGAADMHLIRFVETAEEAWQVLATHFGFDLPPTQTGAFADDI